MVERLMRRVAGGLAALMLLAAGPAAALEVQKVTDGIYALVGEMGQRSPDNLGNNATFGAIVTSAGVVLIDSGGSWLGASAIERALRTITDLPVVLVINTGGQDHRWLGNGYFKAKGAHILASAAAVADQRGRADGQFASLRHLVGEMGMSKTAPVFADETFEDGMDLMVAEVSLEIRRAGPAHTPGDSIVWVPRKGVAFAGDVVYVERMLGVGPQSSTEGWLSAFERLAALKPKHIVPGHGHIATLAEARAATYDYLLHLRTHVRALLDGGGDMNAAAHIDQGPFMHLKVADQLAGRNAQRVFEEMEFD